MPHYTALVTLLAVALYFYTGLLVAKARQKYGVKAPATTGNPDFERVFRVQMNTLEWMPIFLPLLWFFVLYVNDWGAALLGLVWLAGRDHLHPRLHRGGRQAPPRLRDSSLRLRRAADRRSGRHRLAHGARLMTSVHSRVSGNSDHDRKLQSQPLGLRFRGDERMKLTPPR